MSLALTKTYPRLWSLDAGTALVVTDLHGDWDAYQRYRDRFMDLQRKRQVDYLIITGDLIHADPPQQDSSLPIVLDILKLRAIYGEAIIYLCGNHELPHIYGFGLSRGKREYTPDFESTLSGSTHRPEVIELFSELPLYVRTAAGVCITHAGAADLMANATNAAKVFAWDHQRMLSEANAFLAAQNVEGMRRAYARLSQAESYAALAKRYLAVTGPDDPRYDDLLRGFIVTANPDFQILHSALFTRCEQEYGLIEYDETLRLMLKHVSTAYASQQVLVAGHMSMKNGFQIIAEKHLRIASSSHARPRESGRYLLFDTARPVNAAADLLPNLHSAYTD
jgi:Icc-related predicted phosphoesterase